MDSVADQGQTPASPLDRQRQNLLMTRPLLLLDIDGVLNPYGTPNPPVGFTEHHLFAGEEPVRVDPAHGSPPTQRSA